MAGGRAAAPVPPGVPGRAGIGALDHDLACRPGRAARRPARAAGSGRVVRPGSRRVRGSLPCPRPDGRRPAGLRRGHAGTGRPGRVRALVGTHPVPAPRSVGLPGGAAGGCHDRRRPVVRGPGGRRRRDEPAARLPRRGRLADPRRPPAGGAVPGWRCGRATPGCGGASPAGPGGGVPSGPGSAGPGDGGPLGRWDAGGAGCPGGVRRARWAGRAGPGRAVGVGRHGPRGGPARLRHGPGAPDAEAAQPARRPGDRIPRLGRGSARCPAAAHRRGPPGCRRRRCPVTGGPRGPAGGVRGVALRPAGPGGPGGAVRPGRRGPGDPRQDGRGVPRGAGCRRRGGVGGGRLEDLSLRRGGPAPVGHLPAGVGAGRRRRPRAGASQLRLRPVRARRQAAGAAGCRRPRRDPRHGPAAGRVAPGDRFRRGCG